MSFRLFSTSGLAFAPRPVALTLAATALILASAAAAQESTDIESTVTYPAEFFAQYEPYSVNDMLNRIPGISTARGGGGGGPGSSGGENRRGLGAGGDQILINGRRSISRSSVAPLETWMCAAAGRLLISCCWRPSRALVLRWS